jgi:lysophospholipase
LLDYAVTGDAEYQKGYVDDFEEYVDDLSKFVDTVVVPDRAGKAPGLLALGHSMGGGIVTRYAERHPGTFRAIALSSPMHQIEANALEVGLVKTADLVKPTSYALGVGPRNDAEPFEDNELTASKARFAAKMSVFASDPETKIGGPTYHWAAESFRATATLREEAGKVQVPVLLLEAGKDQIVASEGHRVVCDAINARAARDGGKALCTLTRLEGAQHEGLIEVDAVRHRALDLVVDFFDEHGN